MTQPRDARTTALIAGHFAQGTHYYSESKGAMIPIAEMAPKHAANAAERLMREAEHWCAEAGATERPFTWAASATLVRALWTRSQATTPDASEAVKSAMERYRLGSEPSAKAPGTGILPNAYRCANCTFAAASAERMFAHGMAAGHSAA